MASIDKRNGRWRVRYRTPDGSDRNQSFAKKVDAERFRATVEADKARGQFVDPGLGKLTFGQFVEEHYRPTMGSLALTTAARDESYLRTHVLPRFGSFPLASIDYTMCQAWVNDLAQRKAPATTVKAAQICGKVFKSAVRSRRIPFNPMAEVTMPTIVESEDFYLTPAQVEALADSMTIVAPQYRALVWLGCYAGPRIGELAALRWTDLDFLRRTVTINKKVVEVTGHGMVEGGTKTKAGRRTVTLPRRVVEEIEKHQINYGGSEYVFPSPEGGPLRSNNLRRRAWADAVEGADLPGFTFHDMRHTAVSLWVAAGASDLEVAKWAGHRSAAFTKSRYAHLFPEHGQELADRLDNFIESATSTPAAALRSLPA